MKNDNAVPQTAEEVGTQVSGKRAQLAQMLEQASALPNTNEAPKVTGRKRLKKTTKDTEQEDRARIDQVLAASSLAQDAPPLRALSSDWFDNQFFSEGFDEKVDRRAKIRVKVGNEIIDATKHQAQVVQIDGRPIMVLRHEYTQSDGTTKVVYPKLDETFEITDTVTNSTRYYKMNKWHNDLQKQGNALGNDVWLNSLKHENQLNDGLWCREVFHDDSASSDDPSDGKKKRTKGPSGWEPITPLPCYIKAVITDEKEKIYIQVSYLTIRGVWKEETIGFEQARSNGNDKVWKTLAGKGLWITDTARFSQMVLDYYKKALVEPENYSKFGRSKAGWAQNASTGEWEYTAPGFTTNANIPFTGKSLAWSRAGSRYEYLQFITKIWRENPVIALVCGFSAAGVLKRHIDAVDHNPIWVLCGDSSQGKSLAGKLSLSLRGNWAELFANFDETVTSLKALFEVMNDTCGYIDEIGSFGASSGAKKESDLNSLTYQFSLGLPKGSMTRNEITGNYERKDRGAANHFTLLFTGEKMLISSEDAMGGSKVRTTQIIFDENNKLWNSVNTSTEAEAINHFISSNYGHIYPELVHLVKNHKDAYIKCFNDYKTRLRPLAESKKQERKLNSWALTLTGLHMLMDLTSVIVDDNGQAEEGYFSSDFEVAFQNAERLIKIEFDSMPLVSEEESFWNILESIPQKISGDLYLYTGDRLDQAPKGAHPKGSYKTYSQHDAGKDGKGGQVKFHELCIICEHLKYVLPHTMDSDKFVNLARKENVIKLTPNKRKDGTYAMRNQYRTKLSSDVSSPVTVYKFVWTERLTDEIDMD